MKDIKHFINSRVNEGLEPLIRKFKLTLAPVSGDFGPGVLIGDPFKANDAKTYSDVVVFCEAIFGRVDMGGKGFKLSELMEDWEAEYGETPMPNDKFGYIYFPGNDENYPTLCNMRDYTIQL